MNMCLTKLFQDGDPDKLISYVDGLDQNSFSLITFIDSLSPALVMESNLRFGSFHLIKMSLFLRNLSRRKVFKAETERALAKLILQHLYYLEWIRISADPVPHSPDPVDNLIDKMLSEIKNGNAHNAYFYAAKALQTDKGTLFNALMLNGTLSIPNTIGHSISCFYPVIEEVIAVDHPAAGTSLLSLIMYLCRLRKQSAHVVVNDTPATPSEKSLLLLKAASGTSIIDIHHMITFYIFHAWENASWNPGMTPPWEKLHDWFGDKKIDTQRQTRAAEQKSMIVPESFQHWQNIFSGKNRDAIIDSAIAILNESWEKACDWFFRVYADYYTPDWDPHYFTSLYAALELSRDPSITAQDSTMALIQALEYFLDGIE
jgi:hypothetical protein